MLAKVVDAIAQRATGERRHEQATWLKAAVGCLRKAHDAARRGE